MGILVKVVIAIIVFVILRIIILSITKKREIKKVIRMAKEVDDMNGGHSFEAWPSRHVELLGVLERRMDGGDFLVCVAFAQVVLKHQLKPYSSSKHMYFQDKLLQRCHRLIMDYIIATPYEVCVQNEPEYQLYCKNLGVIYVNNAMKNRKNPPQTNRFIKDLYFMSDSIYPMEFIKLCNELYGPALGL